MLNAMQLAEGFHFQTTVEVYTLRKAEHVATLFRSPVVEASTPGHGSPTGYPQSIGDLTIHASGRYLVISSGSSGEAYIYETLPNATEDLSSQFRCIGKVWTRTSVNDTRAMSTNSNESDSWEGREKNAECALLSLGPRWLAFMPPPSSAQSTLHGQVPIEDSKTRIPGVSSHTAPAEPQINCDLDTPKDVGLLNRVAKDVAQGALKGAQWVAAEGIQAWQNYWNRPSESNQQAMGGSPPYRGPPTPLPPSPSFPPTHAQEETKNSKRQPVLISILDLEKLSKSQHLKQAAALQPVATFSLASGCSALSFSPNGLHLLTASAKGDEQQIWDLMRVIHGEAERAKDPSSTPKGPTVRQIARYSRMTPTRIVDVVWTEPRGERFAIITGTSVHIFDVPNSAYQWPPLSRKPRAISASSILDNLAF